MNSPILTLSNLGEAREAMAKLLPHLPLPHISEQMDACGIGTSVINHLSLNLPVVEQPLRLVALLDLDNEDRIPATWQLALQHHKRRRLRAAQFLVAGAEHSRLGNVAAATVMEVDPVVAGLLLAVNCPMPGPFRTTLMRRAQLNWWGAYLAATGLVLAGEQDGLLTSIANDPRLTWALWLSNPDLASPFGELSLLRNDLWSATIALQQQQAAPWLAQIVMSAASNPIASVTALTLQPAARPELHEAWIKCLSGAHPLLAYLALRWSRWTWQCGWEDLRTRLQVSATRSAQSFFHYYRDLAPERADEAARDANVDLRWRVELIAHHRLPAFRLRDEMQKRALSNPFDLEAQLALRWFTQRGTSAQ